MALHISFNHIQPTNQVTSTLPLLILLRSCPHWFQKRITTAHSQTTFGDVYQIARNISWKGYFRSFEFLSIINILALSLELWNLWWKLSSSSVLYFENTQVMFVLLGASLMSINLINKTIKGRRLSS